MNALQNSKLFLYYFFKHLILFVAIIYLDDNYRKPLQEYSFSDITRIVLVAGIVFIAWSAYYQNHEEIQKLSTKKRFSFSVAAGMTAVFTVGYLISPYI